MKYLKLREQINRVKNWKQFLNETALHLLSNSPLGVITIQLHHHLLELEKNGRLKIKTKYHESYPKAENFDLNSINLFVEDDQLYISFIQKFESELKPLIMNFIKEGAEAIEANFGQKRLPRFIKEYDDLIVFPPGRNYGKKVITLKFDY